MDSRTRNRTPVHVVDVSLPPQDPLHCLSIQHISAIDDALMAIGDYGEVRLIKNGGKLRFIQTLRSQPFKESE